MRHFMDRFSKGYTLVTHDSSSDLLPDEKEEDSVSGSEWRWRCVVWPVALSSLLLSCIVVFLFGFMVGAKSVDQNLDTVCLERTSQNSPITKDVKIEYHRVQFNGSLLKENVFRQTAGEEVDAAWASLGIHYRSVVVPENVAQRVGLAADQVKVNSRYGGGYPANVEGLHQLHCLNLVRQALYYNYDYYHDQGEGAFRNSDHVVQKHVSHCLDIIRQQLMCTIDIGVLGQVWFQPASAEYPEAFVDFNTKHICRNFEDVRNWAEERQIPEDVPEDYLQPPMEEDRIYREIP